MMQIIHRTQNRPLSCVLYSAGELFSCLIKKIFPIKLEGSPALFSHEGKDLTIVPIFIVCY